MLTGIVFVLTPLYNLLEKTLTLMSKEIVLTHFVFDCLFLFFYSILSSVLPLCSRLIDIELTVLFIRIPYNCDN